MKYNINNPKPLPSQERLQELLSYDPETGMLTNKVTRASNGKAKKGTRAGRAMTIGYRNLNVDGPTYLEHRIIWRLVTGDDPGSLSVDHINGDRGDNSWSNLRLATTTQQVLNITNQTNNRSGITGVSWHKKLGKWRATASENYRSIHLGVFDSLLDAAAARYRWEREHTDSDFFRTAA